MTSEAKNGIGMLATGLGMAQEYRAAVARHLLNVSDAFVLHFLKKRPWAVRELISTKKGSSVMLWL